MNSDPVPRPAQTANATFLRVALSAIAVAGFAAAQAMLAPVSGLVSASTAVKQFDNSDTAYVVASYGMGLAERLAIPGGVLLLALALIWWAPLRRLAASLALAAILASALSPRAAWAYYDKTDYTEAVTIMPNETAFWIPDNGGNKDSQGRMDSADYYQNNKVPLKRFIVPHQQLTGSGWGPWGNYYVPTGRLILVDRTPFNREWTTSTERGTSARDEGFHCQDRDGHDVTAEITIGTSVFEDNAAKFLYRFGVKPTPGNRFDPQVVFTSVYFGRSLVEVMDTVGRGEIQALVCSQISVRDMDHVNNEAAAMLASIRKDSIEFFSPYGITLDYIGWAGTFTFSDGVQSAIDRTFIAEKDALIAAKLAPWADTLLKLASADALRAFGEKTDGRLPSTIVGLPSNLAALTQSLLGPELLQKSLAPGAPSPLPALNGR